MTGRVSLRDVLGYRAVSLDIGGVLTLPDHGMLSLALARRDIAHDRARFADGHYHAMAEVERAGADPETFGDYKRGFLTAVGVAPDELEAGVAALDDVLVPPAWHQRIPGAAGAARRLRSAGLRLAVTSNADGRVEEMLARHEVLQVGPGPGLEVEVVTDSGIVGHHKPHPRVFEATATALGLPPGDVCHIGDSGSFDAGGARAFGMAAVHVDPLELCDGDHHHVASLADFAQEVEDLLADRRAAGPAGTSRSQHRHAEENVP